MADIIPFRKDSRATIPRVSPELTLAKAVQQFAAARSSSEFHHEIYHEQGRSVLIAMIGLECPVIITSDDVTQLISIEQVLGTVKPGVIEQALHLINVINSETDAGHFEYSNNTLCYRNCYRSGTPNNAASAEFINKMNFELIEDLFKRAQSLSKNAAVHFASVLV